MKKIIAFVLSLMLIMSISASAFACDTCQKESTVYRATGSVTSSGNGLYLHPCHYTNTTNLGQIFMDNTLRTNYVWFTPSRSMTWYHVTMQSGINAGNSGWAAGVNNGDTNIRISWEEWVNIEEKM